tara:strand:+ start:9452 stop:10279 length:828 start_codon:yes stop_codon:yes gene_type:complete
MSKKIIFNTQKTKNFIYLKNGLGKKPFVFLHGFTGSHNSWNEVINRLSDQTITIDLPGHGKSIFKDLDLSYTIDDWCHEFEQLLNYLSIGKVRLCGYSMGGRLAIAFAKKYPHRLSKLYLESTSYGIKNILDRRQRFKDDMDMCNEIQRNYSNFIEKWTKKPLFVKQKARNLRGYLNQQKDRLSHNSMQLSKSLSSFSQGTMKYYLEDISKISCNITILSGAEDKKYVKMGCKISELNKNIKHCIVPKCGHNIHIENLDYFVNVLTSKEKNDNYR